MKKRVEMMEKENEELKTALVLKEDLLKQSRLEKENMKNLVKSKESILEQFQLKKDNIADMVKCPVCLMLPRENKPVPCCPRGHFVCSTCKDRLTRLLYGLNFICLSLSRNVIFNTTVSKRVLILRTWSLIRTSLAFWVLIGSLFIFQGPYFHYIGFIHAKNVNSVSYLQVSVPVYNVGKF